MCIAEKVRIFTTLSWYSATNLVFYRLSYLAPIILIFNYKFGIQLPTQLQICHSTTNLVVNLQISMQIPPIKVVTQTETRTDEVPTKGPFS